MPGHIPARTPPPPRRIPAPFEERFDSQGLSLISALSLPGVIAHRPVSSAARVARRTASSLS